MLLKRFADVAVDPDVLIAVSKTVEQSSMLVKDNGQQVVLPISQAAADALLEYIGSKK